MGRCRRFRNAVFAALILAAPAAAAQDLDQIKAQLAAQQAEIARLRADLEAEQKARAEDKPAVTARRWGLAISGFVQADGVFYNQASQDEVNGSTGAPLNEDRFAIRRAHLKTEMTGGALGGALEIEATSVNDPAIRVFEAAFTARSKYVTGSIGMYRIPFGFENVQRDYDRFFLERSAVIRAMFPGENDLGIGVSGGWRFLRYAFSIMNGDPIGEKLFAYRDPNESKDFLGRAGIDTPLGPRASLRAGFSGLLGTGFHKGTPATKDMLVWRDANEDGIVQLSELQIIPGQPATPSENFDRFAVGGDAGVTIALPRLGELTVYGELVWASNLDRGLEPADPVAAGRDHLREFGWYAGFTQELGRHAMFGVRYDRYNPDADAQEQQALNLVPVDRTYTTIAIAAGAHFGAAHRITLEYDRNTNALGRTMSGLPTTLGSDVLTLRCQVLF
jgi:hypothetical protein